ncbi:hypothetical protein K431DRAFT_220647 [Polychaeton citri CBS 116435]|uniref:Uncharacterized protein n=1 Tax=Polychaeton citri CBS 116435 TaxID=1314669 RepID=A0A9P4QBL7_9PEZI|nr:hypothetical protein K431DRAFT_220647 [Polychaeton citri CBS 116435]
MPTQRPFLSNFLAAFRAHQSQIPKAAPSISTTGAAAVGAQTLWTTSGSQAQKQQQSHSQSQPQPPQQSQQPTSELGSTGPKPMNIKQNQYNTSTSSQPLQHNVSPQTHLPLSPSSTGLPVYGPQNKPPLSYPTCQETRRPRRGSDSSSDSGGFREVRGGNEKWFIGGRSANGDEKYYKLSMVRRDRSADRLSADRLSL